MNPAAPVHGLWCATLTPLDASGGVDHGMLIKHAKSLLARGVDGVAPFGTTGEGQSFSLAERRDGVDALLAAGIPGEKIAAATGCAALPETIASRDMASNQAARRASCCPVLLERRQRRRAVCLVRATDRGGGRRAVANLPVSHPAGLGHAVVGRTHRTTRGRIPASSRASGQRRRMVQHAGPAWQRAQLAILVGHEPHLPRLLRAGGSGTICGVANLYPDLVRALLCPP